MKKNFFKAAVILMAAISFVACNEEKEKINVKATGGTTINPANGYTTSLTSTANVENNGVASVGVVNGWGNITTDTESENPISNDFEANANASASLTLPVVSVTADQLGTVALTATGTPTEDKKTTATENKKSVNQTLTFSDGQVANLNYGYVYPQFKTTLKEIPHLEVTELEYVDYTATPVADNQYKITLHFTAKYREFGVSSPKEKTLDLYPEYLQEATPAGFTYSSKSELVKKRNNYDENRGYLTWTITRSDGKEFKLNSELVIRFTNSSGFMEFHVANGAVADYTEEVNDAEGTPQPEIFTKNKGEFAISQLSHNSKRMIVKWLGESGVNIIGLNSRVFLELAEVTFTDPETGYSETIAYTGDIVTANHRTVDLGKDATVDSMGRTLPYIGTYTFDVNAVINGQVWATTVPETNLYQTPKRN